VKTPLLDFYRDVGPDNRGRYIHDILRWPDEDLERVHDYIQWLFPTFDTSAFNKSAPILTEKIAKEFRSDANLRSRLRSSFERLLLFYGFRFDESGEPGVWYTENFEERAREWVTPGNHNYLRITRMLKSLMALGLKSEAASFLFVLEDVYRKPMLKDLISPITFAFWRNSMSSGNGDAGLGRVAHI
jgi:hypothetical protein